MSELEILSTREAKAFICQGVAIVDVRSLRSYCQGHIVGSLSLPGGRYQLSLMATQKELADRRALLIADTPTTAYESAEELSSARVAVVGAWVTSSEGFQHAGLRTKFLTGLKRAHIPSYLAAHPDTVVFDIRERHESDQFPLPWLCHSSPLSSWPRSLPAVDPDDALLLFADDAHRPLWAAWALLQWGFQNIAYIKEH